MTISNYVVLFLCFLASPFVLFTWAKFITAGIRVGWQTGKKERDTYGKS